MQPCQVSLPAKVKEFWKMIGSTCGREMPSAVQMHAESWGCKKLMSYCLRRIKIGHKPRASMTHYCNTFRAAQRTVDLHMFMPSLRIRRSRRSSLSSSKPGFARMMMMMRLAVKPWNRVLMMTTQPSIQIMALL